MIMVRQSSNGVLDTKLVTLIFEKIAMRTNNFKNVPKMLITRYVLTQCFKFSNPSQFKMLSYSVGIKRLQTASLNSSMKKVLIDPFGHIDLVKDLKQCNRPVHENIEYCRSGVHVIDLVPSKEQPIFAQVVFILKKNEKR